MKNGELPAGWKWISAESLCAEGAPVRYGILQPGPDVPDGVFYLRPTEIEDDQIHFGTLRRTTEAIANQYRRSSLRPNDIILSIVGTIGKVAVVPEWLDGGNITQSSARIRADTSKVLVNYLAHCLRSPLLREQFGDFEMGTAVRRLNIAHVRALQIPVPPLAEQQRIVGILDEAFEGIATAKANAEKNLQNARALFESHLQSVFTQRGEGWVETTIGDQLTLQRGFDITKNQQNDGDVPVVSSGGIKSYHDKAMAKGPGVVIGRKGTLGKVFYLENEYWPHDTTLWIKDFKGNEPRFAYYLFAGLDVKQLDSGAANPALNRNQVHPIKITWPPVDQQKALAESLDALQEETQRLATIYERKLAALDDLKKSLLHQAFSGEL